MGAGAGLSGIGGIMNAQASLESGGAQASALRLNAQQNQQNASQALASSVENERRYRIAARKALGSISTATAASGVQMDGSALDVLQESAANAELDALTIRYEGQRTARNYRNQALLNLYGARNAESQGYMGAVGALLGGAAGAYRNS